MNKVTDRVPLFAGATNEERDKNVRAMSYKLAGVSCTVVVRVTTLNSTIMQPLLADGERISSMEIYADGSINAFVRDASDNLSAVIRVR